MIRILEVLIEYSSAELDRTFFYAYSGKNEIQTGVRVLVDFHHREVVGYVMNVVPFNGTLEEYESPYIVKEINGIVDEEPILSEELRALARKISAYYFSPLIGVYQAMLPPSLKPKKSALKQPKIRYETWIEVKNGDETGLTFKQAEVLETVRRNQRVLKSDLPAHLVKALYEKEKIDFVRKEKIRSVSESVSGKDESALNDQQQLALNAILDGEESTYLLEGVTGSGKTEVYLHAAKAMIAEGKTVLMLVPEISLTHQMVRRFSERFARIAILHSGLTSGEKYDQYRLISQGKVDIVIGARSAIFAPLKNLGLIIIDEEQAETYKQENPPYYHARTVGEFRRDSTGCKLVLGSATPTLETKTKALKGLYRQLTLTKRFNDAPLPKTRIVNLLDLQNLDNESALFSVPLREKIQDRLNRGEQVMLLINKRGYAPYIQCSRCHRVLKCPTCDRALSYHKEENLLKCHHCGYVEEMRRKCPNCDAERFYKIGFGSEKVLEEAQRLFPSARCERLDSDVAGVKNRVRDILRDFENRKTDILIGTQMIAKGHDFGNVTLVGVVLADLGLNIPSYRAGERTFSLITQAIGRAGRSAKAGEAIIQTYSPDHYVIYDSSVQDYSRFFNEEMAYRKMNQNPPYVYLTMLTLSSSDENDLIDAADFVKKDLEARFASRKVEVIGPSEPFIVKVNGLYRRKILLKYKKREDVETEIRELIGRVVRRKGLTLQINVDPDSDY